MALIEAAGFGARCQNTTTLGELMVCVVASGDRVCHGVGVLNAWCACVRAQFQFFYFHAYQFNYSGAIIR